MEFFGCFRIFAFHFSLFTLFAIDNGVLKRGLKGCPTVETEAGGGVASPPPVDPPEAD